MGVFVALAVLLLSLSFGKDPFMSREDAVGYIVVDRDGKVFKYIVLEGKYGKVKLVKTKNEPSEVLKQGGKTK